VSQKGHHPHSDQLRRGRHRQGHLGEFAIEPTTILWVHRSGLLSIGIDSAYLPEADNPCNVYASIQHVGSPYQKDSPAKPEVLVDRVVLVR
jgi:hypothetical protein